MIKFETESGAVYLFDTEGKKVQRVSGAWNPLMVLPDGEWLDVVDYEPVIVGLGGQFLLPMGKVRLTTRVVSIEEVGVDDA